MKNAERRAAQNLTQQCEFDRIVSELADADYEMLVRALVHLENRQLTKEQYDVWLQGEAGLLDANLFA